MVDDSALRKFIRILVDAFDVDIQIYGERILRQLRDTPYGASFAAWARDNPGPFGLLLRAMSVAVQRIPTDNSILAETVRQQLARLPADLHRYILGTEENSAVDRIAADFHAHAGFRRKVHLLIAVLRLPQETQKKFHSLLATAQREELDALWGEDLVNKAAIGELEKVLNEQHSMDPETFKEHLQHLVRVYDPRRTDV